VLLLGCGTCVTSASPAASAKSASSPPPSRMAAKLKKRASRSRNSPSNVSATTSSSTGRRGVKNTDAVLSLGCGAGVQALAERFNGKPVYAGLDTRSSAFWRNGRVGRKMRRLRPVAAASYGGICPVTGARRNDERPCSGSREDRCEVNADRPCAWQLIYKRLKEIGQLDRLKEINPQELAPKSVRRLPDNNSGRPPGLKRQRLNAKF